jgi:hypothetical protein
VGDGLEGSEERSPDVGDVVVTGVGVTRVEDDTGSVGDGLRMLGRGVVSVRCGVGLYSVRDVVVAGVSGSSGRLVPVGVGVGVGVDVGVNTVTSGAGCCGVLPPVAGLAATMTAVPPPRTAATTAKALARYQFRRGAGRMRGSIGSGVSCGRNMILVSVMGTPAGS